MLLPIRDPVGLCALPAELCPWDVRDQGAWERSIRASPWLAKSFLHREAVLYSFLQSCWTRVVVHMDFSTEVAHVLLEGRAVCVGRSPDSHVPLQSTEFPLLASRAHASFHLRSNKIFIRDLNSTNGTFVHDLRVPPGSEQPIQDHAFVSFGGPGRVINHGSLCPNPFCYRIQVLRSSPNPSPISVTIQHASPESIRLTAAKHQSAAPLEGMDALEPVIDLTKVFS